MIKLLITISIFLIASTSHADEKTSPAKMLSTPGGRYAFGQVSDFRRDQYLLDTQTGRLWRIISRSYKNKDGTDVPGEGFPILDIVPFADIDGKISVTPK